MNWNLLQNTGHKVCGWKRQSWNLAHIIQCSDEDNRNETIRPHDAGKQYLDRFCPGWPKTPDPPVDGETPPCPVVKPMTGDMHHQIYWWKPEGGVYRSAMFPWRYPIQGLWWFSNRFKLLSLFVKWGASFQWLFCPDSAWDPNPL